MKTTIIAAAAVVTALALGSSASAKIKASVVTGTPKGYSLVETFDAPAAKGFSFSPIQAGQYGRGKYRSGVYNTSIKNVALEPTGDTSDYYAIMGPGTVGTFTSKTPLVGLSVEIGSIDAYNKMTFYDAKGDKVGVLGGDDMLPGADHGKITHYYDFVDTSGTFDKVVFSSTGNSFEIDNIGVLSAAPEPSTWMLMIAGVGVLGLALRRKLRLAPLTA